MVFIPRTVLSESKHPDHSASTLSDRNLVTCPNLQAVFIRYESYFSLKQLKKGSYLSVNSLGSNYFYIGLYELQIGAEMSFILLFVRSCTDQSDFCMIPTFAVETLQSQPKDKHSS